MNASSRTQVVIIGAGPTGLSLAVQLLRYHIDFVIIERNLATTPLSKAVVIQARTLEIFREVGLDDKAIAAGRFTTAMNMYYKGKRKIRLSLAGLGDGLSQFPFALSLEQSKTEKLLADYLSEKGHAIQWGCEFIRLEQKEVVSVYYKNANGEEQRIEAGYVVGCDGAGSLVRHQMGLAFEGDTIPKMFYVADIKLSSPVINQDELFIFLIKKGFALFFPMEGTGHYRMIGVLPDKKEDDAFSFDDIAGPVKEQMDIPVSFEEVRWFSSYKVHSRKAGSFLNGRCFIAGDAAHIHTPAGGQGMNTGIQDAYNLAWKLAYTINGYAAGFVLDSYSTEREENARQLLRTTDKMFDMMTGAARFWNFFRLHIFPLIAGALSRSPLIRKRFFPLLSQTGIAYPGSSITIKSGLGKVRAGDRMHYFVLPDGSNIFDHLTAPAFKILFFGTGKSDFDQLKEIKFPLIYLSFDYIPEKIFGDSADFYVLLRPDNHVSYIGKDVQDCELLLNRLSG